MADDKIQVFMNTWANYNEYGADDGITPTGWMDVDEALEYCEKYAEYEPFINDTEIPYDGIGEGIDEYSNAVSALEMLKRFDELDEFEKKIVGAYFETVDNDFDKALDVVDSGEYMYIEGSDDGDLGYNYLSEFGDEIPKDLAERYFDYEAFGKELEWDFEETENGYKDEDGWEIEATGPEDLAYAYIEEVYGDEIPYELAKQYFDYDAFGRDLTFDGFNQFSEGYIYWE